VRIGNSLPSGQAVVNVKSTTHYQVNGRGSLIDEKVGELPRVGGVDMARFVAEASE
jgi:hypothetical protein